MTWAVRFLDWMTPPRWVVLTAVLLFAAAVLIDGAAGGTWLLIGVLIRPFVRAIHDQDHLDDRGAVVYELRRRQGPGGAA